MTNNYGKFLYFLLTLFLSITGIFFVLRLTPGDPVERILGQWATFEEIQKYRKDLYLDLPIYLQFFEYLKGIFTGDLGVSFFKNREILSLLKSHAPPTLFLAFFSMSISTPLGIFLGMVSARKKSQAPDHLIRLFSLIALSFPIFSLAPILVLLFSIKLRWFPVSGSDGIIHFILPILVLVIPLSSVISRIVRNKFLEEDNHLWVLYLHAKGLSQKSIDLRILKISLPTILNVVALQLSVVLAGTMITETIFDIPGMGSLLFESIQNRDYPVVQGIVLYSTIIYMFIYFSINYLNEKIDVRLKSDTL